VGEVVIARKGYRRENENPYPSVAFLLRCAAGSRWLD
jgi:hypothetical protein